MPNWCNNTVVIDGDAQQVKELNEVMEALENLPKPAVQNGFGNTWLGCLVYAMGENWEDVDCRGEWSDRQYDAEKNTIRFEASTAWGPHHLVETMKVVQDYFDDIHFHYMSEESGCGLYVTNDSSGVYFPWGYNLQVCDLGGDCWEEVYQTLEEVYPIVSEYVKRPINTKEGLDKALDELNDLWNDDGYIYLNEYQYDEENG